MESQADLSTAADDESASVSGVPASSSSRTKRKSKKCKKCGSIVQNLSRHQSDVHKMSKMKRKLDVYVTRERKPPNRRIKFCPLSPCKREKKPIFQLHKHLQTGIHKLKPGTPAYLNALSHAPRASFKKVESHLKRRKNGRQEKQYSESHEEANWQDEDNNTHEEVGSKRCSPGKSDEFEDEDYEELATKADEKLKKAAWKIKHRQDRAAESKRRHKPKRRRSQETISETSNCGSRKLQETISEASNSASEVNEGDGAYPEDNETVEDIIPCSPNIDSARVTKEDYETLARGALNKMKKTSNKRKHRGEDRREDNAMKTITDSDEEYDNLTRRLWNNSHEEKKSERSDEERKNLGSKEISDGGLDGANGENVVSCNQPECFEISDSDESGSDPDYECEEEINSSDSSQSDISLDSSSLPVECEELLTEFVEIVGESNVDEGSLLDKELDWLQEVTEFKENKLSHGHVFKTPVESTQELVRSAEEYDKYVQEELCCVIGGDQSDNDDALDTDWNPSDCDIEEGADVKTENNDVHDELTGQLLTEFYEWLIDVDGGYRSEKMAQQYKSQVRSVVRRLKQEETAAKEAQNSKPSVYLLVRPEKEGVNLLKKWLSYAVEKYQPGTVRSYLMSLRLFYKFLTQERKSEMSDVSVDTLNARRDLMTSWSAAQKKKVLKRKLQKYDEDFNKLISSEQFYKVCHGEQRINAIKKLATSSQETNKGTDIRRIVNDRTHCEVRDWLITRLLIDNSGRSGVASGMKVSEFKAAVFYPGTDEDLARYRILVSDHKTAGVYGAAVVWVYDDLYNLMDMYLRTVRSQFAATAATEVEQFFISSYGMSLTSSQVSTSIWRAFQREGIFKEGRICATTIRKSLATGMHVHMPHEKDHLAALAQHKTQTQARYYRVHDKVRETDLGRRAVNKLVSLKTHNIHEAHLDGKEEITGKPWSVEETEQLKRLFSEDIETGAIEEPKVTEKLLSEDLLKDRSIKAVVLKLRRLRKEHMESVEPPNQEEASHEKVARFLSSAAPPAPPPEVNSTASVSTESSRFWRKFSDEQASFLFSITRDMIESDAVKREVVWQRVKENEKSLELELITGRENEEEERKTKQRLTDKVRKMAKDFKGRR